MILTRIQRGAVRTSYLVRHRFETYTYRLRDQQAFARMAPSNVRGNLQIARSLRSGSLVAVALYTAALPLVSFVPTVKAAGPEDSDPLPSPVLVSPLSSVNTSVHFDTQTAQVEAVAAPVLSPSEVSVGKSYDTLAQEEAARQEQARQEALKKQQAAAAALAAQQRALFLVNVPTDGSVMQRLHDASAQVFGEDQWGYLQSIVMRESGGNPSAYNWSSGACGLFQAQPCSKMGSTDVANQISWGIGYIANRYGTPANAWAFWISHGWY